MANVPAQRRSTSGPGGFEEKNSARIAIYGHSWGASGAANLARMLARDGIPVVLTIQAINFYQVGGLLHGRSQIRAARPSRTWILGNVQFNYKSKPASCEGYPWYAHLFMKPHIKIESDPAVWRRGELSCRVGTQRHMVGQMETQHRLTGDFLSLIMNIGVGVRL